MINIDMTKMSNEFENSQEYRKALEIAKKQQEWCCYL